MTGKIKIREGDIICIPLKDGFVASGIILHVSRLFPKAVMLGIFDTIFTSMEEIDPDSLTAQFAVSPNYVGKAIIVDGDWPVIGHSQRLLEKSTIPELAMVTTIYYKDEIVKTLDSIKKAQAYPSLAALGKIYVEEMLRKHFGILSEQ